MEPAFDGETIHSPSLVYRREHGVRFDGALLLILDLSVARMSYLALATTGMIRPCAEHRMSGSTSLWNGDLDTGAPDPIGDRQQTVFGVLPPAESA